MSQPVHIRGQAILRRLPYVGPVKGAEVGVFTGKLSRFLLVRPELDLLMVDSWEGNGAAYHDKSDWHCSQSQASQNRFMKIADLQTSFAKQRRTIERKRSVDAAVNVDDASLGFVFIDADHSEAGTSADIAAWWPKIKVGGMLCGHDYGHEDFPGVKVAVDAFVAANGLHLELDEDHTWFVAKGKRIDIVELNGGNLLIELRPPVSTEQMLANMRSALARGLRTVKQCQPHDGVLSIASGGPSLRDTYQELEGHVAAVNGSLGFLLDKGLVPHFCGVMDPNAHMADIVAADPRVYYLVASNCDPALFDKLLVAGCDVRLWNPTPDNIGASAEDYQVLAGGSGFNLEGSEYPNQYMIGGGTSIGLRLIMLGYTMGYRTFHLHGSDASFRGTETHAYHDRRWGDWVDRSSLEINGYRTSLNFLTHVTSFASMLSHLTSDKCEPVKLTMHGDGLMQSCYQHWLVNRDTMTPEEAFAQW